VAAGDSYAWASPDALRMLVKSLYQRDLGISVRPSLDPAFLAWIGRFLLECRLSRVTVNSLRKLRLALYSRQCINAIEAHTKIDYHARKNGVIYFHRTQAGLDHGAAHMRLLGDNGLKIEVVDRERLVELEPALAPAKAQARRRHLCASRPDRGFSDVFAPARRLAGRPTRRRVRLAHHGERARGRGRPHRAGRDRQRADRRRRLRPRPGLRKPGDRPPRSACACRSIR
jgi:hypothetical protein